MKKDSFVVRNEIEPQSPDRYRSIMELLKQTDERQLNLILKFAAQLLEGGTTHEER